MPLRNHRPYWVRDGEVEPPTFPCPEGNIATDVVVVGAGITGLTAAWRLRELGRDVTVLEMNRVASGTTGHSTGHLDIATECGLHTIARDFGDPAVRRLVHASRAAMDFIERMSERIEGSDFQRVPSYLYAEDAAAQATLQREWESCKQTELRATMIGEAPLPFPTKGAVRVDDQARFNPCVYTRGLARLCADAGCRIYENVRVKAVEGGKTCRVVTTRGIVSARHVVVAVHGALVGLLTLASRAYPYQSYVLGVRVRHEIPDALYWDTSDPYHYTRRASTDGPRLLLIGGEDHRTGETQGVRVSPTMIERYARDRYDVEAIEFRWSHEWYESADGLPFIGRVPGQEHVVIGTAYGGDGLKFGSVAGLLLSDLACDRYNPATELFDPARVKPLASAWRMAAGLSYMARHFIGDRVGGGARYLHQIHPGSGDIVQVEGRRVAVYRDDDGRYHACSPVCTHAGCLVQWNQAEKTWDCPCHGGRYDAYGRVFMAPPREDLPPIELPTVVIRE